LTSRRNELDVLYESLEISIEPLEKGSAKFQKAKEFAMQRRPAYRPDFENYKFEITNIFKVKREKERKTYKKFLPNQIPLFHGSKNSNIVGLLSRGLLPPFVVVAENLSKRTDFGFLGAGLYFSGKFDCTSSASSVLVG
jgi:hypothetical protein